MDRGNIYGGVSWNESLLKKLERDELERYVGMLDEGFRHAIELIDRLEFKIDVLEDYIRSEDALTKKYLNYNNNRDFLRQFKLDMIKKHKEEFNEEA